VLHGLRDCVERMVLRFGQADNGFKYLQLRLVYVSAFGAIGGKSTNGISVWT
jgi:hypothetical protein